MLPRIAFTAIAASALVSTAASATPSFTLELTGQVPTLCYAEVRLNAGRSGTIDEFCNDSNGYEVFAEHSPELAGAMLVVDGVEVALSTEGPTRISGSDRADIATRSLELRLPDGRTAPGGSLSFRVVAL
ncbi:MAG: hypothetical protein WBR13_02730 [Allosphingosinicella sp.]